MVIGCGTNIVLDYLFVFVLNMRIKGAAFATVISQVLTFFIILYYYTKGNSNLKLKFENIEKLINQFNKELEDIKINNLEFSNITFAMDIFFDNIFTDISVQRQINDSIEDIERLEDKVQNILYKLQIKNEEVIKKINNVKNDYISFVEEAS